MEPTSAGRQPSLIITWWTSGFTDRLARHRQASPLELGSSLEASATRGATPRSSIRRLLSSEFSMRLAAAQTACRSMTWSPESMSPMTVHMPLSAMSILFSSTLDRQLNAEATSRRTAGSSERLISTSGSRMPSRTTMARNSGLMHSPRNAAMAWRWALTSSQHASEMRHGTACSSTMRSR